MSERTQCNCCTYRRMLETAKENGDILDLRFERPDRQTLDRWVLVYRNDEPEPMAMFRELTRHCAC